MSKIITRKEFEKHNTKKSCWININNKVYDVTHWMKRHPGGERILLCLGGRDATYNFIGNHLPEVERKYLPSYYLGDLEPIKNPTKSDLQNSEILKDYKILLKKFEKDGYFVTNMCYYVWKMCLVFLILFMGLFLFYLSNIYNNTFIGLCGAACLGIMWQQAAFIGHDIGHNCVFTSFWGNHLFGIFEADFLQGISASWWKCSHNVHHVRTNDLEYDPDIQHIPILAVTKEYFNNVYSHFHRRILKFDIVAKLFVKLQHWHYIPVICGFGRIFLYLQSLMHVFIFQFNHDDGKKPTLYLVTDAIALLGFWIWMPLMFSLTNHPWLYFFFSHAIAGILHIQIIGNHFPCPVIHDLIEDNFVKHQFYTSMGYTSNKYTDWFHGGLQYQVEHHLFPMMPRHNLKYVKPYLKEFCHKHKINYLEDSLWGCVKQIFYVLRTTAYGKAIKPLEFY